MITGRERRLAEFVDRISELERFKQILSTYEKPITVIWGESGIGKSLLSICMMRECGERGVRTSQVVWSETRNPDYIAIMRKIRDDIDASKFNKFTDLLNYFTKPNYNLHLDPENRISVATGARIEGTTTRDIAGIIIKDALFVVPRTDISVTEEDQRSMLTDQFIKDLSEVLRSESVVVFFDAVERIFPDAERWLMSEIFQAIVDGRLNNIWFVLCSQKQLDFHADMKIIVDEAKLQPLESPDVIDYLEIRGIKESHCLIIAETLLASNNGIPRKLAMDVDILLTRLRKSEAHEWLRI